MIYAVIATSLRMASILTVSLMMVICQMKKIALSMRFPSVWKTLSLLLVT